MNINKLRQYTQRTARVMRLPSYLWPALLTAMLVCTSVVVVAPTTVQASNKSASAIAIPVAQAPLATTTVGGVTVSVTWLYADANRVAIEYIVSGLKQLPGYQPAGCPSQNAILTDATGRQYGKNDTQTRCIMDENWDFRVTQSFYEKLSPMQADQLNLHFTTTVMGGGQAGQPDAQGNYILTPNQPVGEFSFDLTTSVGKGLTIRQNLAYAAPKATALLRNVQINPSFVTAEICITLPDTADWLPEAALISDQGRVAADGWEIVNFKQSKAWLSRNRCYRFSFSAPALAPVDASKTANFQIEVERLVTSLPEVITEAQCVAARNKLAAATPKIAIACRPAGSGYAFEVAQKPADISIDEAYKTVARSFSEVVEGPWTFTVVVE